jgi:hypothetical protein
MPPGTARRVGQWRVTSGVWRAPKMSDRMTVPTPLPRVFLEVLILNGFQLYFPEVLIIQGLLLRVLILLDFKSFIISDLIKNEDFMEVLILGGLGRAFGMDVWI